VDVDRDTVSRRADVKKKSENMDFNVDFVLNFVAGMILGGFIYVKVESFILKKFYSDMEDENVQTSVRKVGFMLTFFGVFFLVLIYYYTQNAILSGTCAGFAIFGVKP
jgi:hypothetical protein